MFSMILAALAVAAIAVSGQSTSDTASAPESSSTVLPDISPCAIVCISGAATINGCSDFTDAACVCASAQAQADAAACLSEHCTSSDLAAAAALQASQCSAIGVSPSGTPSAPNSVPFTLSSSSTEAGESSTTGSSATTTPTLTSTSGRASTPTTASSATTGSTAPTNTTTSSAAVALIGLRGAAAFIAAVIVGALAL